MLKNIPYKGWLFFAILLWLAAFARFYQLRQMATPEAMTTVVSKDLQKRQAALDRFLANDSLVVKMFENRLSEKDVATLSQEPFYLYAFKGDYDLLFWNNNTVVGTCSQNLPDENNQLYKYNGTYYKQCLHPDYLPANQHLVVLFPIRFNYFVQNEYLKSTYAAASYIPVSTLAEKTKSKNNYAVKNNSGQTLFYLHYQLQDLPHHIPDSWLGIFFIAAVLCSIFWLHFLVTTIAKKHSPLLGLSALVFIIAVFLFSIFKLGIPFHFGELQLFSPSLYASNAVFSSLGILLILAGCLLWILVFITVNFKKPIAPSGNFIVKTFTAFLLLWIMVGCGVLPVKILDSLVLNSNISFDVSEFYAITPFTIIGLFAVVLILICNTLVIYCSNFHLTNLLPNKLVKYALLLIFIVIYFFITTTDFDNAQYFYAVSLLVFLLLFDFGFANKKVKVFSIEIFSCCILISLFATFLLHHYNTKKASVNEKAFAEKVVRQRDNILEFVFNDIADSLSKDPILENYFAAPRQSDRSFIDEHITTRYLRGQLNRYQTGIYLFDAQNKPVFNTDTTSLTALDTLLKSGLPVSSDALYYFENAKNGLYYLAQIPLFDHSGTIVLSLQLKKDGSASVYPELLQSTTLQQQNAGNSYSYGIYAKRELINQNNDFPFPYFLRTDSLKNGKMRTLKREGYNLHIYQVEDGKRVAIIDVQEQWIEWITLFSYLMGIFLLCVLFVFVFSFYMKFIFQQKPKEQLFQMTLRSRIHLAMLSVVMLSFVVIGVVTIFVFVDRYDNNNKMKLRKTMQVAERAVQDYFKSKNIRPDAVSFHHETSSPQFKNYLFDLANKEHLDINVYNFYGSLNATSQENIYNKALLARIMAPDAYYKMSELHKSLLVEVEKIGSLQYLSSYIPVRDNEGNTAGYINIPFFASQKELNYQISNILVALINLYTLIFLVSGALAVGIANWLTKGLQVLIEKFKTFDLKENEKIAWAYDDEIGLLLREYNKMVEKVVENAKRLAQSERESAWREMAKQVAHEIKNPLTPMKLNIQYLQQAMDRKQNNIEQLTKNVTASLIEQIDTLSNIASAFSDFAKMPEATPEWINLNEVIKNAVELYNNSHQVQVHLEMPEEKLISFVDKTQLLRVCNNLLKNALEAIPEDRQPNIHVSLEKKETQAILKIQDNGSGISDETAAHIFSPYFTTKGSGTGLGLAMTKRIIDFWKGKIYFETAQDKGTTFFIELPIMG